MIVPKLLGSTVQNMRFFVSSQRRDCIHILDVGTVLRKARMWLMYYMATCRWLCLLGGP